MKNPKRDLQILNTVPGLIWWVKTTFGEPDMNAINEQTGCYLPMGSHTARYASICAMYYEMTGEAWFKEEAYRNFNHATYMAQPDGVIQTGHNWGAEIWFSDGYTDYIRHFMEGLGAIPEWAPAGENHLLKSSSTVQKISYSKSKVIFNTYDKENKAVLRLAAKPKTILVDKNNLKEAMKTTSEGWTWKPLTVGGILKINQKSGSQIIINL